MPVFRPRNRIEIFRSMAARVVARSPLKRLESNGGVFHLIGAAASELAEVYFQLTRLRQLFSIDTATGSDLDARAAEIQPTLTGGRRGALFGTTQVVFSRPGTTGTVAIPLGTIVAAEDAEGLVKYRTAAAGSILAGNTDSAPIDVVALVAGSRANVDANTITKFVTRIPGVNAVTNAAKINNGRDRESDREFRARLKGYVQSLSRATPTALQSFATNVQLSDGRRVLFAKLVEPIVPSGVVELFIDDGTGSVEEFSEAYLSTLDTLVSSASGGEENVFTTERPIRDDGTFTLFINSVLQTRGTDYELNPALGQVELTTALTAADTVTANYRHYTGLIRQTQKVMDGDPDNPLVFPGVRGAGVMVLVKAPTTSFQSIQAAVSVADDFDVSEVSSDVEAAIQDYINTLDIGEDVIAAEIVERAMGVNGVINFRIQDLSGSTPPVADQVILKNQVARIVAASITLV